MHGAIDLTGLALVMAVAVGFGLILIRLRLPAMMGYIVAGVGLGPAGFGVVNDSEQVNRLAELGVLMLLFIAGVELSAPTFQRVLKPASTTALGQLAGALALSFGIGAVAGWDWRASATFGFLIALSSTAAAFAILDDIDERASHAGEVTAGVMIAQDILVVPMLIMVEGFGAGEPDIAGMALRIAAAIACLAAVLLAFGDGRVVTIPESRRLMGRTDLIALGALAGCFGAAGVSGVLGLSPAYGAFLIGLVVGNTNLREEILRAVGPIQSLLLVVFFLSIGLLIDGRYILDNWILVSCASLGVIVFKSALNIALLRFSGLARDEAIEAGLAQAQIGEFSFILAAAALTTGVFAREAFNLAIAVTAATLLFSPFWTLIGREVHRRAAAAITRAWRT
jgi:K+:H+ antiporter